MLRTILLDPIFNLLLLIYAVLPGHDFGVAIIVLTIIIRLLLWPLVKKQLYHQKTMKELQPELAKIKQKAKGDRAKESKMTVELFKEKGVNPFGSLGLALVQFPILIALFFVLRDIIDPTQISESVYGFVGSFSSVQSIINDPGSFHPTLFGVVDLAQPSVVLALLAGLAQFVQARQLTPKHRDKTNPSANLGFQMALLFPILTVIIALNLPSALSLYWLTSSVIAVIQQHIVLAEDVSFMESLLKREKKNEPVRK
jgi:YidC/Oxa1 family membrane protein insertase